MNLNKNTLISMCREEYKAYKVYASLSKNPFIPEKTRTLLSSMSLHEERHYEFWRGVIGECAQGHTRLATYFYGLLLWLFGVTVVLKLLEKKESKAKTGYDALKRAGLAGLEQIIRDEEIHEKLLIENINDERVKYLGSIALGVTDALIELTGILVGSLGVLGSSTLAGLVGLVAGFSASVSMGAASYTQARSSGFGNPAKSAIYTMISYLIVTTLLVLPYLFVTAPLAVLFTTIATSIVALAYLSFYSSVLRGSSYLRELVENMIIVLGVALALHLFGRLIRLLLNYEP